MSLFTETVTLLARESVGRDDLGNDTFDWVQADSPAWVETGPGTESLDASRQEQSTATSTMYLPLGTLLPVEAVGKVVWNGHEWEIAGEVGQQPGGFTIEGYQVVAIKRVTG